MNKTPVSILQEMAVIRKLPLPEYNFNEKYNLGYNNKCFECTVRIGNTISQGIGVSKQDAKHNSASNMLKKLNYFVDAPQTNEKVHASSTFINYVGRLNEFAAAKKLPYATYELHSVTNEGFVITCTFNGYETIGAATTKKQAKQNAACNMLLSDHVKSIDQYSPLQTVKPVVSNIRVDDTEEELKEMYKKYQNLSITSKEIACEIPEPKDSKTVPKEEREILIELIENSTNLKELEDMCKDRGLKYETEILVEKETVLLVLKEKSSKLTVLEQGETYDIALLNGVKRFLVIFITMNS